MNEAIDAIRKLQGGAFAPQQIRPRALVEGVTVRQFRITAVFGDYLRAESLDGGYANVGNEDVFLIAKPYLLRRTPFDGTAGRDSITFAYTSDVARTATNDADETEDQVVVPSYVVGDVIYATRGIQGGTGVEVVYTEGSVSVEWLDDNRDGRAWAKS